MSVVDLDAIFKRYGDWWCKQKGGKCDRMNPVQSGYEQYKMVVSDEHIEYYGNPNKVVVPQIASQQVLVNATSVEQSQSVKFSKATSSTFTWSLQEGIKLGMSVTYKVGVAPIMSVETTISGELSFSSTQTNTQTETKTWEVAQPVIVPAKTQVQSVLIIDESRVTQNFHNKFTLSGSVCSNSPSKIDGHYYWFHSVADIFTKFPQAGFTVRGNQVFYSGDGSFDGVAGIGTRLELTESPIGDPSKVLKAYTLIPATPGAGVARLADIDCETA
ncbi:ETX/MTX2 family pore-forming toxin [Pseudomonas aegrilactucae]|uniref:ETX/MTX2 family pore-forming toxin n=1 Tax=Pseudomonas aegrilactucae TaxID=2854028 RepID=A0A9Q2XHG5_9PSED|nr:ETX/MTX2 family pore-forming toxin [Pseudomonas aegrilactucae]MBV6286166.1 ETX/MTX2 family pore-forming toxin [Pseudomonas aegrilactucae]